MVLIKRQIENLSKEELIEELVQLSDISIQIKASNDSFDTVDNKKTAILFSTNDSVITKYCGAVV